MEARTSRLAHFLRCGRLEPRPLPFPASIVLVLSLALSPKLQAQYAQVPMHMPVVRPQPAQYVANGENFLVFAASPQLAQEVLNAAEQFRRELAIHWLGKELPPWSERCPVHVTAAPHLGASGRTEFGPTAMGVGNWKMAVDGSRERILDSVLPHEISHTILASHFAKYAQRGKFVPRWADEGACTTVEHESEKKKHRHYLRQFLETGRGLAFNRMFALKEYPQDILPLYAQGHSAVQFLIDQSSPQEFVRFLESGMSSGNWTQALKRHYDYRSIGQFQKLWNDWLIDGSPSDLLAYSPKLQNVSQSMTPAVLASNSFRDRQLDGKVKFAIGNTDPAPVSLAVSKKNQPIVGADANGELSWYKRRLLNNEGTTSAVSAPPRTEIPMLAGAEQSTEFALAPTGGKPIRTPEMVPIPKQKDSSTKSTAAATTSPPLFRASVRSTARNQPPQKVLPRVLQWQASSKDRPKAYVSPPPFGTRPIYR
ncbi:MAG: hypothetical protein VXZ82_24350 [Planctomycetota bacterium]|nr:hypothetical protein [Planctomycetota bacterium]